MYTSIATKATSASEHSPGQHEHELGTVETNGICSFGAKLGRAFGRKGSRPSGDATPLFSRVLTRQPSRGRIPNPSPWQAVLDGHGKNRGRRRPLQAAAGRGLMLLTTLHPCPHVRHFFQASKRLQLQAHRLTAFAFPRPRTTGVSIMPRANYQSQSTVVPCDQVAVREVGEPPQWLLLWTNRPQPPTPFAPRTRLVARLPLAARRPYDSVGCAIPSRVLCSWWEKESQTCWLLRAYAPSRLGRSEQ